VLQCVAVFSCVGLRLHSMAAAAGALHCCRVLQCVAVCSILIPRSPAPQPRADFQRQLPQVCCSVLQCVLTCFSVLHCGVVCCSVLQCDAVCCSVLQFVAVCCSVLQCGAVWCSMLQL